jgi:drug/metabolite transporter (DMT)-like permease
VAVLLALGCAVVYGTADFLGGLASRRAALFGVVALGQLIGLGSLLLVLPWLGGPTEASDLWWGAAAGLVEAVGLGLFYRSLAHGVMSVVAPVTAVTAAGVPVLAGLVRGESLSTWALAGIGLALVAVVLVSAEGGLSALLALRPASLVPALLAGSMFGTFYVLLDQTSEGSGLTPLVGARLSALALVAVVALAGRRPLRVDRAAWPQAAASGICDVAANALFLIATQLDDQLAITGVLASLYPVSTVVLAQLVLRERLVGAQLAGLAATVTAVVLITRPP